MMSLRERTEEIIERIIKGIPNYHLITTHVKNTNVEKDGETIIRIYYRDTAIRPDIKKASQQYDAYLALLSEGIAYQKDSADPESTPGYFSFFVDSQNIEAAIKRLIFAGEDENGNIKNHEIILDAANKIEYNKVFETLNQCFGTNYSGWMQACWPSVHGNGNFRVWFNKLAKKKNGEFKPASFDCVNTISDDWNEIVFVDLKNRATSMEDGYYGYDLIFSKEPDGPYLFRGVFMMDRDESRPNHWISKRIATKVRVLGKPANDIELLDDFRNRKDINIPLKPLVTEAGDDGRKIITCGNCEAKFFEAPRCPECGQLQLY